MQKNLPLLIGMLFFCTPLLASTGSTMVSVLHGLIVMMVGAKLGGWMMRKIGQPNVLGELVVGVLIGNAAWLGFPGFEEIRSSEIFSVLAELGVIFLLFDVGLESSLDDMLKVGPTAMLVATVGVIVPFILGYGVSFYFLSDVSVFTHIFVGATLCATSVGITARVLQDLGKISSREAKIILGAAVIDDVLGLIILAIVTGLVTAANGGESTSALSLLTIAVKAFGFLVIAIGLGKKITPIFFRIGASLGDQTMLTSALVVCFLFSYLAHAVGLAAIVGAFAAGLIIDREAVHTYFPREKHTLHALVLPLSGFFVPIFFIHMGMQVDVSTLFDASVILFGSALTIAAILGKQVCGLAVLGKNYRGVNRLMIGLGMIPRGEVGLIFALMGTTLVFQGEKIIRPSIYSAMVMMVMLTTMMTPVALKWVLSRSSLRSI